MKKSTITQEAEATIKANKEPKTIKVKTLVIAVSFVIVAIVSFLGGMYAQGKYNDTVHAQAVELSKTLK